MPVIKLCKCCLDPGEQPWLEAGQFPSEAAH